MMKHWLSKKYWADKDVEILMGTLLRFGVIFSGIVVIAGGMIYLVRTGMRSRLTGLLRGLTPAGTICRPLCAVYAQDMVKS